MSKAVRVRSGDTLESIARREYGDETKSDLIERANPGAGRALQDGTTLIIPVDPDNPETPRRIKTASATGIKLFLGGARFRYWSDVSITLSMDSVSTATFSAPFHSNDASFKKALAPFAFPEIKLYVGDSQIFKGTLVSPSPRISPKSRTISAQCYATAGVLGDCTAPVSNYPLEWDNAKLETIARALCKPFGIHCEFPNGSGQIFERQSLGYGQMIMQYLIKLAKERNFLITSTNNGGLRFYKAPTTGKSVAVLQEGLSPLVSVSAAYDPQKFYSHITGIAPASIIKDSTKYTVKNPRMARSLRPYTFEAKDIHPDHITDAVISKAGRMFSSAIEYSVEVSTWLDMNGDIWSPGSFVKIICPSVMIEKASLMQIKEITLNKNDKSETASLTLILPGSISGQLPETYPWEE